MLPLFLVVRLGKSAGLRLIWILYRIMPRDRWEFEELLGVYTLIVKIYHFFHIFKMPHVQPSSALDESRLLSSTNDVGSN